jgi:translation initiation factor 1
MAREPKSSKIPLSGERIPLASNPFTNLELGALPDRVPAPELPAGAKPAGETVSRNRGRVDLRREKSGRGGKTVTLVSGFMGVAESEKEEIASALQRACGCGGTVKDGAIELQGDRREAAAAFLRGRGFKPVMAGG